MVGDRVIDVGAEWRTFSGEAGGEDEVGQAGEGGQAEDGPPVVRTDLPQVEPLTVTQSHSVSV